MNGDTYIDLNELLDKTLYEINKNKKLEVSMDEVKYELLQNM